MTGELVRAVGEHGDLAHVALTLWALSASGLCLVLLKQLEVSNRRFSDFVDAIERLNEVFRHHDRY